MSGRLLLVAALVLAAVGCEARVGGGRQLDVDRLESEVATGIEEQNPGVTVESVDCPDDVEIEEGHTFTCTANIAGGESATVTVTQTDDEGNVDWSVGEG